MIHPVIYDEWGGYEEPECDEETIDDDIIELLGDEDEFNQGDA